MNAIDSFPPKDMPLRARLPTFTEATRARLITWAELQPGSLPWLIRRTAELWDKFPHVPEGLNIDEHCMNLDATASLELLRHRVQCVTDREAVEHLNHKL